MLGNLGANGRHVDTPFVFGAAARAGAQDHQLAAAQRDAASVQQAAGYHALQDARIARHCSKQEQRRSAAHEVVEFCLHVWRIWGIDGRNAGRRHGGVSICFDFFLWRGTPSCSGVTQRPWRGARAGKRSAACLVSHSTARLCVSTARVPVPTTAPPSTTVTPTRTETGV